MPPLTKERLAEVGEWINENNLRHESLSAMRAFARSSKVKGDKNAITAVEVEEWYKSRSVNQIRLAPHRTEASDRYVITANPFTWMVDVMHMDADLAPANDRIKSILLFVDVLTRFAMAYPIKNERTPTIIAACEDFANTARQVNGIIGDNAFDTREFHDFWGSKGAVVDTVIAAHDHRTASGDRLGIIDRLVLTIRGKLTRWMDVEGSGRWLDGLDEVMEKHNEAVTSALDGRAPSEVYEESDLITLALKADAEREHNRGVAKKSRVGLEVGDKVRVRVTKKDFGKAVTNWSREVFTIAEFTFHKMRLSDSKGREVARLYSKSEVLKVTDDAEELPDLAGKARGGAARKRRLNAAGIDEDNALPIGRRGT
jgi:hypothetical protein